MKETKDAYVDWRGFIPTKIKRHRGFKGHLKEKSEPYLLEIEQAIEQAELWLQNNLDPILQSEVDAGREYLKQQTDKQN